MLVLATVMAFTISPHLALFFVGSLPVLAVTLAPRFGIQFVWMAVPMGWLVNYLISFFQYRTGKWAKLHKASSQ